MRTQKMMNSPTTALVSNSDSGVGAVRPVARSTAGAFTTTLATSFFLRLPRCSHIEEGQRAQDKSGDGRRCDGACVCRGSAILGVDDTAQAGRKSRHRKACAGWRVWQGMESGIGMCLSCHMA